MLHLDPKTPVAKEVGGVTYLLRVLTQREMMRFGVHADALGKHLASGSSGEPSTLDTKDVERLEESLCLGIAGWKDHPEMPPWKPDHTGHMPPALLDAIPFGHWIDLWVAIIEGNDLWAAEAKNSPSP